MAMTLQVARIDEEQELHLAFQSFDQDNDGYISAIELQRVMAAVGEKLDSVDVEEMIRQADVDGDGKISCECERSRNPSH